MSFKTPLLLILSSLMLMGSLVFLPLQTYAAVSDWQNGFSIRPTSTTDFASDSFNQSLSNLAAAHANYVTLIIPIYQDNVGSTAIYAGSDTPTDDAIASAISHAHALGLKVNLKVHVEPNDGQWRAYINPSDRITWFNNYGSYLQHYGQIAQTNKVEEMTIGAELYSMTSANVNPTNTQNWDNLISNLRQTYSGLLTYSAQHTNPSEENEIQFWDKLDYIGLAAYFPLGNGDPNASVDTLKQSWADVDKNVIGPLHEKWQKPVIFTEIGYRSTPGSPATPWVSELGGPYDSDAQVRGYQALFSYWSNVPYMAGVQWWDWKSSPNAGGQGDTDYTPQGKPVMDTINQWFTGGAPTSPSSTVTGTITPTPSTTTTPTVTPSPSTGTPTPSVSVTETPTPSTSVTETPMAPTGTESPTTPSPTTTPETPTPTPTDNMNPSPTDTLTPTATP